MECTFAGTGFSSAQKADSSAADEESKPQARVTGLRYISIHVLELEKSLKLYREIGDKLKEEGCELENENYVRDKYTFFVGPNGEIIGLSSW